ncbi:MAG: shikimate kinase [Thermodesulfobacteriota bacterium]
MKNIILIGYRCTGKTSVGRKLAEFLDLPFYDTDQMIADRIGKTIKTWVEEKGWASFREEEKKVIQELSFGAPGIVSLGGGAVMDPENQTTIRQAGRVIWLKAEVQTILERMKSDPNNQDNRPALSEMDRENEAREILAQRTPFYEQTADWILETDGKTIEVLVSELTALFQEHNGSAKNINP